MFMTKIFNYNELYIIHNMKKILFLAVLLIFFIGINVSFAEDLNGTDLEISDNTTSSDGNLQASVPADGVLKSTGANTIDIASTIKASDVSKYYKSSTPYKATFYKSNGKALANVKVKVTVGNKVYTPKTDAKGKVKLSINLKPGNYRVTAKNPSTNYELTTNFKILSTIQSGDLTKVFNNTMKFKAKFYKDNGQPLANKKVKYRFKNSVVSKKTNRHGEIYVSMKSLKKGKYKIILYHPDGLKKTFKIKVVKSAKTRMSCPHYTILKGSSRTVKVKVTDQFGYKVPSRYVVKAKFNGKTYKSKTNRNGIAKFKVTPTKKGIHSITFKFIAKKYYKSSKMTKKVYVVPSKNVRFTVKSSTSSFGKGAHTPFKLLLTSGNVPIIKKTVKFKVAGKTYYKTTDNTGRVSLPIDLNIGKYTIRYSIVKDSAVDAKSGHSKITVKQRTATNMTVIGETEVYRGLNEFKVLLKDKNNNALAGKTVKATIKSQTYSATTNSKGYAKFSVIVPLGDYDISFRFEASRDNDYAPSSSKASINATHKVINGYGYWLKQEQFESVTYDNLISLANQGVTDIFLNSKSVNAFGKDRIEEWIGNVTGLGMKVHFWIQIFRNDTGWIDAMVDGKVNTGFYTQKINEIKELSQIKGISGINLDYIRFRNKAYKTPGATDAINKFVHDATDAIRKINRELVISADLMAKMENANRHYAQDYSFFSQYMDVVIPMIYKGNAGQPATWITSTTKWYVENSKGAIVWAGLQTYKSDDDITILPINEMYDDAAAAIKGGADGLVLFRWGLTNYIDFDQYEGEN